MELGNGLTARKELQVRIGRPVGASVPTYEFVKGQTVTLGTRVMFAESCVHLDRQPTQRRRKNLGCLQCSWIATRHQHINFEFAIRSQTSLQALRLLTPQISQADA
jgi:hypothetical protein